MLYSQYFVQLFHLALKGFVQKTIPSTAAVGSSTLRFIDATY